MNVLLSYTNRLSQIFTFQSEVLTLNCGFKIPRDQPEGFFKQIRPLLWTCQSSNKFASKTSRIGHETGKTYVEEKKATSNKNNDEINIRF